MVSDGANHRNQEGLSALSQACKVGSYDLVRLLMEEKAEFKVNGEGRRKTPLMEAAENNQGCNSINLLSFQNLSQNTSKQDLSQNFCPITKVVPKLVPDFHPKF